MTKSFINYILVLGVASTFSACSGGGGSAPSAGANTPTTPEPQAPKTLVVNYQDTGDSPANTVPNDAFGRGFSAARSGIDIEGFQTPPTAAQRTGQVTLNGFMTVTEVDGLDSSQRLQGASNLTVDFTNANATVSGTATNFGVYSFRNTTLDNEAGDCTASTCVYTKVRDVRGSLAITGK